MNNLPFLLRRWRSRFLPPPPTGKSRCLTCRKCKYRRFPIRKRRLRPPLLLIPAVLKRKQRPRMTVWYRPAVSCLKRPVPWGMSSYPLTSTQLLIIAVCGNFLKNISRWYYPACWPIKPIKTRPETVTRRMWQSRERRLSSGRYWQSTSRNYCGSTMIFLNFTVGCTRKFWNRLARLLLPSVDN